MSSYITVVHCSSSILPIIKTPWSDPLTKPLTMKSPRHRQRVRIHSLAAPIPLMTRALLICQRKKKLHRLLNVHSCKVMQFSAPS